MLLKVGSRGDDVKKLQSKLGLGADGVFGPGTEKEVKKWQIEHDLTPDGLVGDGTWAKMFGGSTTPVSVITEPAPLPNGTGLKLEKLRGHVPDAVIAMIPDTAAKFGINTPLRKPELFIKRFNGYFQKVFPNRSTCQSIPKKTRSNCIESIWW